MTVADDDATTGIELSVAPDEVAEGAGAIEIMVTAALLGSTRGTSTELTVTVAGSGVEEAVGFTAVADFGLTIAAESATGTATFTLTPDDDALDEDDETVTVSGTVPAVAGLTVTSAELKLTDDEELEVSVTVPASVAEGAAAPFTVTLAGGTSTAPAAVSYTVGGTATAGTDYTAPSGTLTLAAGAAAGTITVATLDDAVLDPGETLKVTLDGATTAARTVAVSGSPATATIVDGRHGDGIGSAGDGDGRAPSSPSRSR